MNDIRRLLIERSGKGYGGNATTSEERACVIAAIANAWDRNPCMRIAQLIDIAMYASSNGSGNCATATDLDILMGLPQ